MTETFTPAEPDVSSPKFVVSVRPPRRDLWVSLLLGLCCLIVYNANLRSISAGDTYPARYLPFGIWRYHTVLLDPISSITAQGRKIDGMQGRTGAAYWIVRGRGGHAISLYPLVTPALIAPLYLPAVIYLYAKGWDQPRLELAARIMEKVSASLLAAIAAALLYLLMRRRASPASALLLTVAFAFGTSTWVISSQALWQHGLAELLIVAALLLLTGPCTIRRALALGFLCGLIACNRPPDSILAAALGIYGLLWAKRLAAPMLAAAAVPVGLILVYNLRIAGNVAGAYGLVGKAAFFEHGLLSGLAGLLFSPTRGLFVFCPFLLFVPMCLLKRFRDRRYRGLTIAVGIAAAVQLLLYAKADWRQGDCWGPRWLTDILPILVWMLQPVVSGLCRAGRIVFLLACGGAMAIQAIGAFWYTGRSDAAIFARAAGSNQMRAAWDLRNTPFIVELRHRRAPAELGTDVRGSLDTIVTSGGTSKKAIDAEGWALADGHSPREVIVLLDGRSVASTVSFFARPDVSRSLGTTSLSGWRVSIPAPDVMPGNHVVSALVRAYQNGDLRFLAEKRFTNTTPPSPGTPKIAPGKIAPSTDSSGSGGLALNARMAVAALTRGQQAPGYWLTSYTDQARFEAPRVELNTFLTSVMIDMLNPVATQARLGETLQRARHYLTGQIEAGGLVRYHGRPDAPTIGTLGCAITPDTDDTALVWRIAPAANRELLPMALATIDRYRTPEGLYRTWLSPRDRYQCINPGKDPNPADVGIQMHLLMLLSQQDPAAAHSLCRALGKTIDEDRIWVYYRTAPLIPILRQADMKRAGCSLRLPPARLQTAVPGQEDWIAAGQQLQRILGADGTVPSSAKVLNLLRKLSKDDFSSLRRSPPLLYHNDLSASVRRFYWSEEFGYALWLRLYFENLRHSSVRP